ncbi:MAG TPA: hypothetical protein VMY35_04550, partial [Phycisphaerae bacterium]|nr:hypothetical protein [Phycisphaerae bacterium]
MATIDINVPLDEWVREVVKLVVAEHQQACPLFERVRRQEIRFSLLVGYMMGSGLVGGLAGGLLSRMM